MAKGVLAFNLAELPEERVAAARSEKRLICTGATLRTSEKDNTTWEQFIMLNYRFADPADAHLPMFADFLPLPTQNWAGFQERILKMASKVGDEIEDDKKEIESRCTEMMNGENTRRLQRIADFASAANIDVEEVLKYEDDIDEYSGDAVVRMTKMDGAIVHAILKVEDDPERGEQNRVSRYCFPKPAKATTTTTKRRRA